MVFKKTLNSEMKRLRASKGATIKRAELITLTEEATLLWDQKLLGDHSPQVLVDIMGYMCSIFFALRASLNTVN